MERSCNSTSSSMCFTIVLSSAYVAQPWKPLPLSRVVARMLGRCGYLAVGNRQTKFHGGPECREEWRMHHADVLSIFQKSPEAWEIRIRQPIDLVLPLAPQRCGKVASVNLCRRKLLRFPVRYFSHLCLTRTSSSCLSHKRPASGCPYKFRSSWNAYIWSEWVDLTFGQWTNFSSCHKMDQSMWQTPGSLSTPDHDFVHLCRGRRIRISGQSDFGTLGSRNA